MKPKVSGVRIPLAALYGSGDYPSENEIVASTAMNSIRRLRPFTLSDGDVLRAGGEEA